MEDQRTIAVSFALTSLMKALSDKYNLPVPESLDFAFEIWKVSMRKGMSLTREEAINIVDTFKYM